MTNGKTIMQKIRDTINSYKVPPKVAIAVLTALFTMGYLCYLVYNFPGFACPVFSTLILGSLGMLGLEDVSSKHKRSLLRIFGGVTSVSLLLLIAGYWGAADREQLAKARQTAAQAAADQRAEEAQRQAALVAAREAQRQAAQAAAREAAQAAAREAAQAAARVSECAPLVRRCRESSVAFEPNHVCTRVFKDLCELVGSTVTAQNWRTELRKYQARERARRRQEAREDRRRAARERARRLQEARDYRRRVRESRRRAAAAERAARRNARALARWQRSPAGRRAAAEEAERARQAELEEEMRRSDRLAATVPTPSGTEVLWDHVSAWARSLVREEWLGFVYPNGAEGDYSTYSKRGPFSSRSACVRAARSAARNFEHGTFECGRNCTRLQGSDLYRCED